MENNSASDAWFSVKEGRDQRVMSARRGELSGMSRISAEPDLGSQAFQVRDLHVNEPARHMRI